MVHYSNPGMHIAGRIIEVLSGKPYNLALEDEIYAPVGMTRSWTSPKQAILHRIAVGSHPDPETGVARATSTFMLPEAAAAAGSTPIVTVGDLLNFGQMLLAHGVAPNGTRVLAASLADAMATETFNMNTPSVAPVGLGWWLPTVAGTKALWQPGGSPGGISTLVAFPELDLVIANFANSPMARTAHDVMIRFVLEEHFRLKFAQPYKARSPSNAESFAGVYGAQQSQLDVSVNGEGLRIASRASPLDAAHLAANVRPWGQSGNPYPADPQPVDYVAVGDALFFPRNTPLEAASGLWGRTGLLSFHSLGSDSRYNYTHGNFRTWRRRR